jgi:hypothetical protein
MVELFQLILGVLASLFKSRARLEAENLCPAPTSQRTAPAGAEATAAQQYRPLSAGLALSLVPFRLRRDCDRQTGDDHPLASFPVPGVLALAVTQSCRQTERDRAPSAAI